MTLPRRHICILGDGFEGWLAATMLAQSFDSARHRISVVPVAGASAWDALYAVQPWQPDDALHRVGLTDTELLRRHGASYSLGARIGAAEPAAGAMAWPYGPVGVDYGGVDFHHIWRCEVEQFPNYMDFSPGAQAMASGRFAPPATDNAIGTLQHEIARHVDAESVTGALRHRALSLGVEQAAGPLLEIDGITPTDTTPLKVIIEGAPSITADLYIDCSGARRVTSRDSAPTNDWSEQRPSGPSYAVSVTRATASTPALPFHDVQGSTERGWRFRIPLQHETLALAMTPAELQAGQSRFRPGRINAAWRGKVCRLGHAAHHVLPSLPLQTLLLNRCIDRLIASMPVDEPSAAEMQEFNALTRDDVDSATALLELLHPSRIGENDQPPSEPQRLAEAQRQLFGACGRLRALDSDLLDRHEWAKALVMSGIRPERYDIMAEAIPAADRRRLLGNLSAHIGRIVGSFPALSDYLGRTTESTHSAAVVSND